MSKSGGGAFPVPIFVLWHTFSMNFDYSLNGLDAKQTGQDQVAIQALMKGDEKGALAVFGQDASTLPYRLQEVQALIKAGYQYTFDPVAQTYHWFKP